MYFIRREVEVLGVGLFEGNRYINGKGVGMEVNIEG